MRQPTKHKKKRLVFTVTNDLNFDQRMIRICSSLTKAGYDVLLVGRRTAQAATLQPQPFRQKRLFCYFQKGAWFYAEYNIRLFFFLLLQPMDLVGAIDLDTILPCYLISVLRRKKRVYDAHELFCEMKEVVSRPRVYRIWKSIERFCVPRFQAGYTVNKPIKDILEETYGVRYEVIMNVPFKTESDGCTPEPWIIYQGAVNHGRSFETLIPAFQWIDMPLHIYGDGNFLAEAKALVQHSGLTEKILFKGKVLPSALKNVTPRALIGISIFEHNGLNNYYSLANRFFDYIQACIPQVGVNFPAYKAINDQFEIGLLLDDLSPESIAKAINTLIADPDLRERYRENCKKARRIFNWEEEEKKLIRFYEAVFE